MLAINRDIQRIRAIWVLQDFRRDRERWALRLLIATVVVIALAVLVVSTALSAPLEPECPPAAVTLQEVKGQGSWERWLFIACMAVAAICIMVIGSLRKDWEAHRQEKRRALGQSLRARQAAMDRMVKRWRDKAEQ